MQTTPHLPPAMHVLTGDVPAAGPSPGPAAPLQPPATSATGTAAPTGSLRLPVPKFFVVHSQDPRALARRPS